MGGKLDEALARLVARGVLDAQQAAAVAAEVAGAEREETQPGLPAGAELAAWVGAVLAAAAGVTAATRFWSQLTVWAQSALLALVAVGLLAAGRSMLGDARAAARRLTGVTWLLAMLPAGAAVGIQVAERSDGAGPPWLAAALTAAALGAALWRVHEHALQLLALVAAVVVAVLAGLGLADAPPSHLYGLVLWSLGAALFLLAQGGLARPERAARWMAALLAVGGAQVLAFAHDRPATVLQLATAAGLFWLAGRLADALLTAVAAVGLAMAVPQVIEAWFPGSLNAAATLFVSGVALLAGGLAAIRRARAAEPAGQPAAEPEAQPAAEPEAQPAAEPEDEA